jgi:hypothetical protein
MVTIRGLWAVFLGVVFTGFVVWLATWCTAAPAVVVAGRVVVSGAVVPDFTSVTVCAGVTE